MPCLHPCDGNVDALATLGHQSDDETYLQLEAGQLPSRGDVVALRTLQLATGWRDTDSTHSTDIEQGMSSLPVSTPGGGTSPATHEVGNVIYLPVVNAATVTGCLGRRFCAGRVSTFAGSTLVVLNPYNRQHEARGDVPRDNVAFGACRQKGPAEPLLVSKPVVNPHLDPANSSNPDKSATFHADGSTGDGGIDAHLFHAADAAMQRIESGGGRVGVLVYGASGSGKTTTAKRLLEFFFRAGGSPMSSLWRAAPRDSDQGSSLAGAAVAASDTEVKAAPVDVAVAGLTVLECFTSVGTISNTSSSRATTVSRLRFTRVEGDSDGHAGVVGNDGVSNRWRLSGCRFQLVAPELLTTTTVSSAHHGCLDETGQLAAGEHLCWVLRIRIRVAHCSLCTQIY